MQERHVLVKLNLLAHYKREMLIKGELVFVCQLTANSISKHYQLSTLAFIRQLTASCVNVFAPTFSHRHRHALVVQILGKTVNIFFGRF